MARNVIKYRLTEAGDIPQFLYLGQNGVNGMYGVYDSNTPAPRNVVQIGITNDNATGDFEIIQTKADLLAYLTSVSSDWRTPDPTTNSIEVENSIPFDPLVATNWVWDRFIALGGI